MVRSVTYRLEASLTSVARCLGAVAAGFLVVGTAAASGGSVVARYVSSTPVSGTVTVTLTAPDGSTAPITLRDDGVTPDTTAKDKTWTGTSAFAGSAGTAVLTVGGKTYPARPFIYPSDQNAKGMGLSVSGGSVTVDTLLRVGPNGTIDDGKVAENATPPTSSGGAATTGPLYPPLTGAETPGVMPGAAATGGATTGPLYPPLTGAETPGVAPGAPPPGVSRPTTAPGAAAATRPALAAPAGDIVWLPILGAGALALGFLIAFRRFRSPSAGFGPPGQRITPEPERGLVGALPAASDGITLWVAAPDEVEGLVEPLLATLAAHHRVIVAAADGYPLPRVHGGPVYRVKEPTASGVLWLLTSLSAESTAPTAVLLLNLDGTTLTRLSAALPPGTGGVALSPVADDLPALPRVDTQAIRGGWTARFKGGEQRIAEGSDGRLVAI